MKRITYSEFPPSEPTEPKTMAIKYSNQDFDESQALRCWGRECEVAYRLTGARPIKKTTHATIEGTQGPTFGGGYRVTIFSGKRQISTAYIAIPAEYRTWEKVTKGIEVAYGEAKKYCASFGVF